eukprot:UN10957
MVVSASATRSLPFTSILKLPSAKTPPVVATPFMVRVTMSPTWKSPVTVPVIATVPPDSEALIMSSAVIFESRETVAITVVSD